MEKEKQGFEKKFNFFMIKFFRLQKKELLEGEKPEIVIQFLDISKKILYDNMRTERKYMAYMNSTISHEMRNPLNSICASIQSLSSYF